MSDSFNGIATFQVLEGSAPQAASYTISVRPIPGGNTSYVDLGGQQLLTRTLLLKFTSDADYTAFLAQRGNQGTLVCFDGTFTAILTGVRRTDRNPPGTAIDAQADFLLL